MGWTAFTAILWVGSLRINGALAVTFSLLLLGFILQFRHGLKPG